MKADFPSSRRARTGISPTGPNAAARATRRTLGGLSYVDRLKFKDVKKRSGASHSSSGEWKAQAHQEFILLRLANTLLDATDKDIESYLAGSKTDARSMEQFTLLLEQYVQLRGAYRDGEKMMNETIERILGVIGRYVADDKGRRRNSPQPSLRKAAPST